MLSIAIISYHCLRFGPQVAHSARGAGPKPCPRSSLHTLRRLQVGTPLGPTHIGVGIVGMSQRLVRYDLVSPLFTVAQLVFRHRLLTTLPTAAINGSGNSWQPSTPQERRHYVSREACDQVRNYLFDQMEARG